MAVPPFDIVTVSACCGLVSYSLLGLLLLETFSDRKHTVDDDRIDAFFNLLL
jgi:hypothetical protein